MADQHRQKKSSKVGRQAVARRTKPSRVRRRQSLGAKGDRGPCRSRRKSPPQYGVQVKNGTGGRVLLHG